MRLAGSRLLFAGGTARNGILVPEETTWVCNAPPPPGYCTASPGAPPLDVAVEVSTPANGLVFQPGERPVLQLRFIDGPFSAASVANSHRLDEPSIAVRPRVP
jgi:hypothetical protein